ncbi:MAG UNVERIFIED_CONTAM: hypothetical protein LVR18_16930 [Planctomycetaceae bacterium]
MSAGTTAADVLLIAIAGSIQVAGEADADAEVVGQSIELIASTGIGNNLELGVNGVQLGATTTTGDIIIVDTTGGLDVNTVNVNGDASSTEGVTISAGSTAYNISIRTMSPLTISSNVSNATGGDIVLAAEGTAVADNLSINADVSATGGNGSILSTPATAF